MRTAFFNDISAAARALRAVAESQRDDLCLTLFRDAETADRYTRRFGKMHPSIGRGTLREAAEQYSMVAETDFDDPQYCACLKRVLDQLCQRPRSWHL